MKKLFRSLTIFIGMLCMATAGFAQTIQWASEVIDVSSEFKPPVHFQKLKSNEYAAEQILGKPNVLPGGGDNPNAWAPSGTKGAEFITVGFEEPMRIRQVAIAESYNPSTTSAIYLIDTQGQEHLLREFTPELVPLKSRILDVFFDQTEYEVKAVKVFFDGWAVPGYFAIDAIGISDSVDPIKATIKMADNINEDLEAVKLGPEINSPFKELKPLLTEDGTRLYFSRKNHPENIGGSADDEDIWFSRKNEETGEWMPAENAGSPLNNEGPNFISSITPDGNTMIFTLGNAYLKNDRMTAGVSYSVKTDSGWSAPQRLAIKNEENFASTANYFMSSDRNVLLMSVQREDGQGNKDLYASFKESDGTYSEPKNLGTRVNSAANEISPYLAKDGRTLYFSSNGFSGFGGQDIYVTRRLDETWEKWTEPENLGPDINSEDDDLFFFLTNENKGYFVRGAESDADIYYFDLPLYFEPKPILALTGKVLDKKTNLPVAGARVRVERLPDGQKTGETVSGPEGDYEIQLPPGQKYGYYAEAEEYYPISENIDLTEATSSTALRQDLYLVPVEPEVPIRLSNIFFDFNKAELKEESFPELNRLVTLMKDNPSINIRIEGHTDAIGTEEYNERLSLRRANAIFRYLTENNISYQRLETKGYGESRPIATNETDAGRAENRRVEFVIKK
ncbi:OmpA family protein [Roseivirga sp. BDSF3-8]|uniref:OmpA family protein n=1 Tax=Roseivirga sp. BDSF3-8 TaxID=3241598 RepID=UPI00353268EC